MEEKTTYSSAGVDIDRGNTFVDRIKPLVKNTFRKEVMGNIGGFGGFFHLDMAKSRTRSWFPPPTGVEQN